SAIASSARSFALRGSGARDAAAVRARSATARTSSTMSMRRAYGGTRRWEPSAAALDQRAGGALHSNQRLLVLESRRLAGRARERPERRGRNAAEPLRSTAGDQRD